MQMQLALEPLGAVFSHGQHEQVRGLIGLMISTDTVTALITGHQGQGYLVQFGDSPEAVVLAAHRLVRYIAENDAQLIQISSNQPRPLSATRIVEMTQESMPGAPRERSPRTQPDSSLLDWLMDQGLERRTLEIACRKAGLEYGLFPDACQEMRIVLSGMPHDPRARSVAQTVGYAQRTCVNIALTLRCQMQGPCSLPPDVFFRDGLSATGVELNEQITSDQVDDTDTSELVADDAVSARISAIESSTYRHMALDLVSGNSAADCARMAGIKDDSVRKRMERLLQTFDNQPEPCHV